MFGHYSFEFILLSVIDAFPITLLHELIIKLTAVPILTSLVTSCPPLDPDPLWLVV